MSNAVQRLISDPITLRAMLHAERAENERLRQIIRELLRHRFGLRVDGYAGYKILAEKNAVNLAFCWSHAQRKFFDLAQSGLAPIATERWRASPGIPKVGSMTFCPGSMRPRQSKPWPETPLTSQRPWRWLIQQPVTRGTCV